MANLGDKTEAASISSEDALYAGINMDSTPLDRWVRFKNITTGTVGRYHIASFASLSAAVSAIGSANAILMIDGSNTVAATMTVPTNIILEFVGTGQLSVSAGQTLTIHSDSRNWPLRQIFTGTGTYKFGNYVSVGYPQWFGAILNGDVANATADTLGIQATINAFVNRGATGYPDSQHVGIVEVTGGGWLNDTIVIEYGSITLRGQGWGGSGGTDGIHRSYLRAADALDGLPMLKITRCWGAGVEKLFFIGNVAHPPSCAINFHENIGSGYHATDFSFLSHIYIGDMGGYGSVTGVQFVDGITFTGSTDGDSNSFRHVSISGCSGSGIDNTDNPNAADSHWDTLIVIGCGSGFKGGSVVVGTNWLFALNDVDLAVSVAGANWDITHFTSEGSSRLAVCDGQGTYLRMNQVSFGLDSQFSPADSGNDRWIIDCDGSYTHWVELNNFFVGNYTGATINPVIRMGNSGGSSDSYLRLIDTNLNASNIKQQPVAGTGDYIGNYIEIIGSRAQDGITPPQVSRCFVNGFRSEDASYQSFRWDGVGKHNIFGGPLKVKAAIKPSSVAVVASVGSGATTYGYRVSALTYDGETEAAASVTCTNGATLDSTHKNLVTWRYVLGAYAYKIYGRTSGSELLLITIQADNVFAMVPSSVAWANGWTDDGSLTPSGALPTKNGTGRVYLGSPDLAPTDSEIDNGQFTFYLDVASNKLKVRVRYPDGTLKDGELALT